MFHLNPGADLRWQDFIDPEWPRGPLVIKSFCASVIEVRFVHFIDVLSLVLKEINLLICYSNRRRAKASAWVEGLI